MKRILLLALLLAPIVCQAASAEEALRWLTNPDLGLFTKDSFVHQDKDGTPAYVAQDEPHGFLAAVYGPDNEIEEIQIMAGVSDENIIAVPVLFEYLSKQADPSWEGSLLWIYNTLTKVFTEIQYISEQRGNITFSIGRLFGSVIEFKIEYDYE